MDYDLLTRPIPPELQAMLPPQVLELLRRYKARTAPPPDPSLWSLSAADDLPRPSFMPQRGSPQGFNMSEPVPLPRAGRAAPEAGIPGMFSVGAGNPPWADRAAQGVMGWVDANTPLGDLAREVGGSIRNDARWLGRKVGPALGMGQPEPGSAEARPGGAYDPETWQPTVRYGSGPRQPIGQETPQKPPETAQEAPLKPRTVTSALLEEAEDKGRKGSAQPMDEEPTPTPTVTGIPAESPRELADLEAIRSVLGAVGAIGDTPTADQILLGQRPTRFAERGVLEPLTADITSRRGMRDIMRETMASEEAVQLTPFGDARSELSRLSREGVRKLGYDVPETASARDIAPLFERGVGEAVLAKESFESAQATQLARQSRELEDQLRKEAKLEPAQVEKFAGLRDLQARMTDILERKKQGGFNTGLYSQVSAAVVNKLGMEDVAGLAERNAFQAEIVGYNAAYRKLISGANVSWNEIQLLQLYTPKMTDDDASFEAKARNVLTGLRRAEYAYMEALEAAGKDISAWRATTPNRPLIEVDPSTPEGQEAMRIIERSQKSSEPLQKGVHYKMVGKKPTTTASRYRIPKGESDMIALAKRGGLDYEVIA